MTTTAALIHAAIAGALIVALFRGRSSCLWMIGFVAPMQGLRAEAGGVAWQWTRLLPLLLIVAYLAHPPDRTVRQRPFPGRASLGALVVWALVVSGYFFFFDSQTERLVDRAIGLGWGTGQTTLRHPVQYLVFLSYFGSAFVAFHLVSTQRDLHAIIAGFIAGNLTSIVIGGYQLVAIQTALPILEITSEAFILDRNASELRLWGLGGEPKHTGAMAITALAAIMAIQFSGDRSAVRPWKTVVLLAGVALTLSTSSYLGVTLVLAQLFILSLLRDEGWALRRYLAAGAVVAASLMVFAGGEVTRVVDQRVQGRLFQGQATALNFEPKDGAYIEHISESPEYIVTGHGAGGVDFFLIDYLRADLLPRATSITPTYTLTRLVSDFGMVGLLLTFTMVFAWWRAARARIRPSVGDTFILVGGVAALVAPFLAFVSYLLLAAAFAGYYCSLPEEPPRRT